MSKHFWNGFEQVEGLYDLLTGHRKTQLSHDTTLDAPKPRFSHAGVTVGSSVVGIKFDGGVLVAADTLVSYGSLARYQNVDRVFKINDKVLLGGGGDFPDVQSIKFTLDQKVIDDYCRSDGIVMNAKAASTLINRILYGRRIAKQPLLVELVIGGIGHDNLPYLGSVDMHGGASEKYVVATGFGHELALPLVRDSKPQDRDFTLSEAAKLIRSCMKVMYYRDTRSIAQYTVGICTECECDVKGPFKVEESWKMAEQLIGF
ncbi:hypothetical protein ACLKA7_013371 [Drosophila subpalustris]